jgi:hypothetical protein
VCFHNDVVGISMLCLICCMYCFMNVMFHEVWWSTSVSNSVKLIRLLPRNSASPLLGRFFQSVRIIVRLSMNPSSDRLSSAIPVRLARMALGMSIGVVTCMLLKVGFVDLCEGLVLAVGLRDFCYFFPAFVSGFIC